MSSEKYIGLDVHQATISVAVVDSQGKVVMESILETKASTILEFLAGVMEEGQWSEPQTGTPQRSVISPLLANVYKMAGPALNDLECTQQVSLGDRPGN